MIAGDAVQVLVVWAHATRPRWFGGYRFVRREGATCIVEHTRGVFAGVQSRWPAIDVRPGIANRVEYLQFARRQVRWAREQNASIARRAALGMAVDVAQVALVAALRSAERWRARARGEAPEEVAQVTVMAGR